MVDRFELATERRLEMRQPREELYAAGPQGHDGPAALARPLEERQLDSVRFVGDRQRSAAGGP